MITTYRRLTARAERHGRCPECGRVAKRTRTFEMTVSPFNKHKEGPLAGQVRTPREVQAAVRDEADRWAPSPDAFTHAQCREATS